MLTAKDIMRTDPITISSDSSIEELSRRFLEADATGFAVTDAAGKLIGIVTENDLISRNKKLHMPTVLRIFDAYIPLEGRHDFERDVKRMAARTVVDVCSTELVTLTEDSTLEDIATIMSEQKTHHLPVLRGGQLVGMVTQHDVIRGLARERAE